MASNYVECFKRLAQHNLLGESRYFNEQTALAIAVIKCGVPYEIDNHRMDKSFFHYYSLPRLTSFETHRAIVAECVRMFSGLREILAGDTMWQSVIADSRPYRSR